jgi:hypothetical protein
MQALDQVMLWVARIFAFSVLISVFFCLEEIFRLQFTMDVRETFFWRCMTALQFVGSFPAAILVLILCALSNISLWLLRKNICRLYLGFISGLLLLVFVYVMLHDAKYSLFDWRDNLTLIGGASMLWASLRLPHISKPSGHHPINDHPLPQSC